MMEKVAAIYLAILTSSWKRVKIMVLNKIYYLFKNIYKHLLYFGMIVIILFLEQLISVKNKLIIPLLHLMTRFSCFS